MRNHYVPQFLQSAWTSSDGKLLRYKIETGAIKRLPPKANGFKKNLLSLTKDQVMGMDKHAIEKAVLQKVDNDAAAVIDKLINDRLVTLSHIERCAWVRFVMSIRLRQPSSVHLLRLEGEQILRMELAKTPEEYSSIAGTDSFPTLEEWTEALFPGAIENFGLSVFQALINNGSIGTKLLRLRWWVRKFNEDDHSLMLGDNPCVLVGKIDDPDFAIMLPISPRAAFIATRGDEVAHSLSQISGKVLSKNFNDVTVRQAEQYIYAANDGCVTFIRNRRPPKDAQPVRQGTKLSGKFN